MLISLRTQVLIYEVCEKAFRVVNKRLRLLANVM